MNVGLITTITILYGEYGHLLVACVQCVCWTVCMKCFCLSFQPIQWNVTNDFVKFCHQPAFIPYCDSHNYAFQKLSALSHYFILTVVKFRIDREIFVYFKFKKCLFKRFFWFLIYTSNRKLRIWTLLPNLCLHSLSLFVVAGVLNKSQYSCDREWTVFARIKSNNREVRNDSQIQEIIIHLNS